MSITKAEEKDLAECVDIIFFSQMGKVYYPKKELIEEAMVQAIKKDDIYVLREPGNGDEREVLGVIWYQKEGMFHSYPYLHMIAVKDGYHGQGIGTALMDFFENDILENGKSHIQTRAFLTVGDFNKEAERLYIKRGYVELFQFKGLFRRSVTEKILMKTVIAKG